MERRSFLKVIIAAGVAVNVPLALLIKPEEYQFCNEAKALFDAMTEDAPIEWKIATDINILDLKGGGVWNKLDCLYRFGEMSNENDSLINWKA